MNPKTLNGLKQKLNQHSLNIKPHISKSEVHTHSHTHKSKIKHRWIASISFYNSKLSSTISPEKQKTLEQKMAKRIKRESQEATSGRTREEGDCRMERERPQASILSWREDWLTKALCFEKMGCWIAQRSIISSSQLLTNLTLPLYEPSPTTTFSSSSSTSTSAAAALAAIIVLFLSNKSVAKC